MHALFGREVVFLPRLDIRERGIPLVLIARCADGAELARAVLVGEHLLAQRTVSHLGLPDLAEAEIEALVAGVTVDYLRLLAFQRDMIGLERYGDTGIVGDVLAHRVVALDMQARQRLIRIVLRTQRLHAILER